MAGQTPHLIYQGGVSGVFGAIQLASETGMGMPYLGDFGAAEAEAERKAKSGGNAANDLNQGGGIDAGASTEAPAETWNSSVEGDEGVSLTSMSGGAAGTSPEEHLNRNLANAATNPAPCSDRGLQPLSDINRQLDAGRPPSPGAAGPSGLPGGADQPDFGRPPTSAPAETTYGGRYPPIPTLPDKGAAEGDVADDTLGETSARGGSHRRSNDDEGGATLASVPDASLPRPDAPTPGVEPGGAQPPGGETRLGAGSSLQPPTADGATPADLQRALDQAALLSPTFERLLATAGAHGVEIKFGDAGSATGTRYNADLSKTLEVDPLSMGDPLRLTRELAHELSHATQAGPWERPLDQPMDLGAYVEENVALSLQFEADAEIAMLTVRDEIFSSELGVDIGVVGENYLAKHQAWESYKHREISESELRTQMARLIASESAPTGITYREYYSAWYLAAWNKSHAIP